MKRDFTVLLAAIDFRPVRFAFGQTRRRLPPISIWKMALANMGNGE